MKGLQDKSIVVTGGGSGIGEAVALAPAVLQMFTLRPLSGSAGNVLTVPYPQKCSDSVLTAF